MLFNTVLLSALAATAFAAPRNSKRVLHERRAIIDPSKGDRIDEHSVIPVRIGLKQNNLEHGYDMVMDVSDPDSANYGKHWTLEQVRDYFAPSDESIDAVKAWLVESGIPSEYIDDSDDKQWLAINVPVRQAEDLLGAEYHEYEAQDGTARIGCDEYYLPEHISRHVDYIKPGVSLSPPLAKRTLTRRDEITDLLSADSSDSDSTSGTAPTAPGYDGPGKPYTQPYQSRPMPGGSVANSKNPLATCGLQITIDCIRALYNIPPGNTSTPQNALGIAEFSPDAYSQQDLNMYFKAFAPYVPQGTHPNLVSIDGGKAPVPQPQAGGESDIDFSIAIPLVYPQSVTLYQVGPVSFNGFNNKQLENEVTFLLPFLDAIDGSFCTQADRRMGFDCGTATLTRVLSVSYGFAELFLGQPAVIRTCNEIMKLSLQGSTIIFSSGDYGVAAVPQGNYNGCINKNFVLGQSGTIFSPDFPVDCPYVLAVGATQLEAGESVNDPEEVLYQPNLVPGPATFSSGGGFSNYFKRPSYQDKAVLNYLNNYVPPYPSYTYNGFDIFSGKSNIGQNGGIYNRVGRGFPDVSANGANFTAFIQGQLSLTYGTSLSAPIWGSIITLINEERTKAGQGPVGFIQPTIYQHPEVFNDITRGTNPGCGTQGFPASPGWDPPTGLGTPDYPKLLALFQGIGGYPYSSSS